MEAQPWQEGAQVKLEVSYDGRGAEVYEEDSAIWQGQRIAI